MLFFPTISLKECEATSYSNALQKNNQITTDEINLGCIYTTGGCWEDSSSTGEKYIQQADKWLTIKKMNHERIDHALVSLGGNQHHTNTTVALQNSSKEICSQRSKKCLCMEFMGHD